MKRKVEITIERERVLVARGRKRMEVWCASCGKQVSMMTADDAAIAARVNSRTIFRWVEAGKIHYMETPEGLLFICPYSLSETE